MSTPQNCGSNKPVVTSGSDKDKSFINRKSTLIQSIANNYYNIVKNSKQSQRNFTSIVNNIDCTDNPGSASYSEPRDPPVVKNPPDPSQIPFPVNTKWTNTETKKTFIKKKDAWSPQLNSSSLCMDCLNIFLKPNETYRLPLWLNQDFKSYISKIRESVCRGVCYCEEKNVNITNTVNVSMETDLTQLINPDELKQIGDKVSSEMKEKFGESSTDQSGFNKKIVDIITKINVKTTQNVQQAVISMQSINMVGTGGSISNLTMNQIISGIMDAVASTCTDSQCGIDMIVTDSMNSVRCSIIKQASSGLKESLLKYKNILIGICVTVVSLVLLNIVLSIIRAGK
jgi:hypothetical protein